MLNSGLVTAVEEIKHRSDRLSRFRNLSSLFYQHLLTGELGGFCSLIGRHPTTLREQNHSLGNKRTSPEVSDMMR